MTEDAILTEFKLLREERQRNNENELSVGRNFTDEQIGRFAELIMKLPMESVQVISRAIDEISKAKSENRPVMIQYV